MTKEEEELYKQYMLQKAMQQGQPAPGTGMGPSYSPANEPAPQQGGGGPSPAMAMNFIPQGGGAAAGSGGAAPAAGAGAGAGSSATPMMASAGPWIGIAAAAALNERDAMRHGRRSESNSEYAGDLLSGAVAGQDMQAHGKKIGGPVGKATTFAGKLTEKGLTPWKLKGKDFKPWEWF